MRKTFTGAMLAAASLATAVVPAMPVQAAQPRFDAAVASAGDAQLVQAQYGQCYRGERSYDCRERLRVQQQSHRRYVYRNGRYEDQSGAAVAGAILGFVLGAAIAGSTSDRDYYQHHRNDRGWRNRCQSAYSGFDYRTGTYLGRDGYRHYCTR